MIAVSSKKSTRMWVVKVYIDCQIYLRIYFLFDENQVIIVFVYYLHFPRKQAGLGCQRR